MSSQPNDVLDFNDGQKPALPSALNVLTILTFIGSGLAFLGSFWTYYKADESYKQIQDAQTKMADAPAWAKRFMGPEMVEMARKAAEYKLPIMIVTIIGAALCIYGALEMRKLKKQGFPLWVAGEFLPVVASGVFLGAGAFSGFALFGIAIPIVFLILYAVNRKHLIY